MVQRDPDITEYADPAHNPMIPHVIVVEPEFMASDHSVELASLKVPLLALRPGFNEKLLADPTNSWYKTSFQDAWDAFSKKPRIQVVTIPNACALLLDDQPKLTDEAIATFIARPAAKQN
jgi:hypothetical protein